MNEPPVLHHMAALADGARARLLHLLEAHELTVSELCTVVQLPQSTVSRQLGVLREEGWVTSRAEGTSRYYRLAESLEPVTRRLWEVVREPLSGTTAARQDVARAREVVARRPTRRQAFFAETAGGWDAVRAELFGVSPELPALLMLLDPAWEVGDLGCGTGRVAEWLAPHVRRVVAVDESPVMLAAAGERLSGRGVGVEFREGRLESLPLEAESLDVALLALVLRYVEDPAAVLAESWRVLRPGGRVLVVDMVAHDRAEYRAEMGHVWQGFERSRVEAWLAACGYEALRGHELPPDPAAKGPLLFAMVGMKPGVMERREEARG